ncbi:MAG: RIP metalloprotease RseP [Clostridia bacterium]|nr:RIP metalloprotease RseP [Clostridia bacterium]
MLSFIITIIKLLVILGVVATIHEFGHFLASKLCKIGVNEFSIGFGPKILQKEFKGTVYTLRCLPLGGYCAIEGEEGTSDREDSFSNKNVFQKIFVLVMGVVFNAILAIVIFLAVSFSYQTATTKITELSPNSVLAESGVQVGDTIISIDGEKVKTVSEILNKKVDENSSSDVEIEYERNGEIYSTVVKNAIKDIGYIGITFAYNDDKTDVTNVIELVAAGGAANEYGLKAGDKITHINGIETSTSTAVKNVTAENAGKETIYTIERKGEVMNKTVVPKVKKEFNLGIDSVEVVNTTLDLALADTKLNIKTIVGSYVDLFRGKVKVNDMSGIVGIGEVVSTTSSLVEFFNLMAIISLAVGVANILPFPPLDGGKVVIVIGEAITRKKLPAKAEAIISYIGFGLLILLTLIVTYNDIIRII